MENLAQGNVEVQQIAQQAAFHVTSAGPLEILAATLLPAFALLVGIVFNRWLDRRPHDTIHLKLVDFIAPLLGPLLAVALLMAAGYTFRSHDIHLYVLPFAWKVAVAWLAIKLVILTSSRQSAGWVIVLVIIPVTLLHLFGLWDPATEALNNVQFTLGTATLTAYGVMKSAAALVALLWVTGFIVNATDARLRRIRRIHVSNRMLIMKFFQIVLYFVVFLIGLQILGVSLAAFSVLGGAVGVGVGFGLQKIASNFMSGVILLFEKTVSVDDMIQLEDGTTGFIRQTAARYTMMETTDGRKIFIPNEEFITQRVTTLTHTDRLGQINIPLLLHFDTDIDLARKLLVESVHAHPNVTDDPAPGAYVTGFGDNGLQMRLLFWVKDITAGTYAVRTAVITEIMRRFREHRILIAYPHQVAASDRWGRSINTDTDAKTAAATDAPAPKKPKSKAAK